MFERSRLNPRIRNEQRIIERPIIVSYLQKKIYAQTASAVHINEERRQAPGVQRVSSARFVFDSSVNVFSVLPRRGVQCQPSFPQSGAKSPGFYTDRVEMHFFYKTLISNYIRGFIFNVVFLRRRSIAIVDVLISQIFG